MAVLDRLRYVIGADSRDFRKEFGRSGKAARQLDNRVQNLRRTFGGLRAVAIGAASVLATGVVRNSIRAADAIGKTAKAAGLSAETLQEYRFAAERSGVATGQLDQSLIKFNRRVGLAARGQGAAVKEIERLNISLRDQGGNLRSNDDLLDEVIGKIGAMETASDRAAAASQFFGDEVGPKLAVLLAEGSAGVEDLRRKARELGIILSNDVVAGAEDANDQLGDLAEVLSVKVTASVVANAGAIGNLAEAITTLVIAAGDGIGKIQEFFGRLKRAITDQQTLEDELKDARGRLKTLNEQRNGIFGFLFSREQIAERKKVLREIEEIEKKIRDRDAGSDGGNDDLDDRVEAVQKATANASELFLAQLERDQAALERQLEDAEISYAQFFARRTELQRQSLDQQIALEREALDEITNDQEAREKILTNIAKLETERAALAGDAAREQAKAEEELATKLQAVQTRLLGLQGNIVEARKRQLEAEFKDLLERLEAEGDVGGQKIIRKIINIEVAKAEFEELKRQTNQALSDLSRQESSIDAQLEAGALSELQARRQILEVQKQTQDRVRALIPDMRRLAEATGDPAAIERVKDLEAQIERLGEVTNQTITQIDGVLEDSFTDAFAGFIDGTSSAKDAFDDLVSSVLSGLARIAAEQAATQLFGLAPGGSPGGFFASLFHSGGVVGRGSAKRSVSPMAFLGAPRLHDGGKLLGLKSDERPAILQLGETVLEKGASQTAGMTVVNNFPVDGGQVSPESASQVATRIGSEIDRAVRRNR